jgi:hypothetical protein
LVACPARSAAEASRNFLGSFLHTGLVVADDRLPREGRRLLSDRVLARWSDGSTVAWRRRRATVGRGEGSSGLRFDQAEPD